jgi:hypothetical protein
VDVDESTAHLAQHLHDPHQQRTAFGQDAWARSLQNATSIEDCSAFHRGPTSDRVVAAAIGDARSSHALGEVDRNRERGTPELIGEGRVAAWKLRDNSCCDGHELNRTPISIQLLETEEAASYLRMREISAVSALGCVIRPRPRLRPRARPGTTPITSQRGNRQGAEERQKSAMF